MENHNLSACGNTETFGLQWAQPTTPASNSQMVKPQKNQPSSPATFSNTARPSGEELTLEGRAIQIGKLLQNRKEHLDIRKICVYIPDTLFQTLTLLKEKDVIDSFSQVVKEALYQYLTHS